METLTGLDTSASCRHWLHDPEGTWSETNCYSDLWVQLLHRLGLDPVPALAFVLATRFEGEQWTFAKPSPEDLWRLYGIRVGELFVWRPLLEHVDEAARVEALLTTEVDAHWLPDTSGTTYRNDHEKTTIVPLAADRDRRWLRYLHNAGCYELEGADFDELFRGRPGLPGGWLPPYTELVSLTDLRREPPPAAVVTDLVRTHLARRPAGNPVTAMGERMLADLPALREGGVSVFHPYAFATARQLGAVATMAAAVAGHPAVSALTEAAGAADPAADFREVANGAKTAQFLLARAARGREVDLAPVLDDMGTAWERGIGGLARSHAG